ncbi:MAG: hypothetical protein QM679_02865 [Patulibacter sp.]
MSPTPHLAWPPRLTVDADGEATFATVEQDTRAELASTAALLCTLQPGDLPWAPSLGVPSLLGEVDPDEAAALAAAALADADDRAEWTVTATQAGDGGRQLVVSVAGTPAPQILGGDQWPTT